MRLLLQKQIELYSRRPNNFNGFFLIYADNYFELTYLRMTHKQVNIVMALTIFLVSFI